MFSYLLYSFECIYLNVYYISYSTLFLHTFWQFKAVSLDNFTSSANVLILCSPLIHVNVVKLFKNSEIEISILLKRLSAQFKQ